uniref:Uncharacterized protein n=1 Tax=Anguilla anguilla TaxID=7936 RepID=A0A0E9VR03_ANGAN
MSNPSMFHYRGKRSHILDFFSRKINNRKLYCPSSACEPGMSMM